jgi:hypothetical protein
MIPRVRCYRNSRVAVPRSRCPEVDATIRNRRLHRQVFVSGVERVATLGKQTWDRYSGIAAGFAGWRMTWQISSSPEAMNSGVLRAFVISPTFTGSAGFGRLDLDWIRILP